MVQSTPRAQGWAKWGCVRFVLASRQPPVGCFVDPPLLLSASEDASDSCPTEEPASSKRAAPLARQQASPQKAPRLAAPEAD
eukprot:6775867-Alexandrium_andersonii.AAC.1